MTKAPRRTTAASPSRASASSRRGSRGASRNPAALLAIGLGVLSPDAALPHLVSEAKAATTLRRNRPMDAKAAMHVRYDRDALSAAWAGSGAREGFPAIRPCEAPAAAAPPLKAVAAAHADLALRFAAFTGEEHARSLAWIRAWWRLSVAYRRVLVAIGPAVTAQLRLPDAPTSTGGAPSRRRTRTPAWAGHRLGIWAHDEQLNPPEELLAAAAAETGAVVSDLSHSGTAGGGAACAPPRDANGAATGMPCLSASPCTPFRHPLSRNETDQPTRREVDGDPGIDGAYKEVILLQINQRGHRIADLELRRVEGGGGNGGGDEGGGGGGGAAISLDREGVHACSASEARQPR